MSTQSLPTLRIPADIALPDKGQWQFRFEIKSSSSDNVYVVAQNKTGKWWGCSCFGWRRYRHCQHLKSMGIPGNHTPYEPKIID